MISQTVEYSLRAVVCLAHHQGTPITVQRIAELARIPAPYLSKLMQGLVRAELVRSRRGLGGGFVLARAPEEISVWDIVQVVDPIKRIESCPLGIEGHISLCPLHRRLDQALASVEKTYRETRLDELLRESGDSGPLCDSLGVTPIEVKKSDS